MWRPRTRDRIHDSSVAPRTLSRRWLAPISRLTPPWLMELRAYTEGRSSPHRAVGMRIRRSRQYRGSMPVAMSACQRLWIRAGDHLERACGEL